MTRQPAPGVYTSLNDLARLEHKATGFTFLPRQPVHSLLSGRHVSRMRGRGLNFEELRGYLPGDDPRTIDWKVTARLRKPYVRVFTEERDRPALIVVDQRLNMFFGTKVNMKSVVAAELAALAAWRVFHQGDRPGALVFNDSEIREVRPHRSRRRVMEVLGAVVELNRQLSVDAQTPSNRDQLNQALSQAARIAKHDYLVAVLSDFYGADDDTQRLLTLLAQHNDVIVGLLYDPIKIELPAAGRLVVTDGELQIEIDSARGKLRTEVSAYFDAELDAIQERLVKVGAPVMMIDTAEDPAMQVRRILGDARAGRKPGGAAAALP